MDAIKSRLDSLLSSKGFESHPFKIGWYNENVHKSFKLNYDTDTLAFVILSIPKMFENVFIPFLKQWDGSGSNDALDECMKIEFRGIRDAFPEADVDCLHDFEFHHSKRPKILVQTAGHVSGGVYYYQRKDVTHGDPWQENAKIFGVCLHPKYGGWFGLRGIIIFKDIKVPELLKEEKESFLADNQIVDLLNKFNFHWEDGSFRDIIEPQERYSKLQEKYFLTSPDDRPDLIKEIKCGIYD